MAKEFAEGHAAAHGYEPVEMGDSRYTWTDLLDGAESVSTRTDRGKIGSADLYVKEAESDYAPMEGIATVVLSHLGIDHTNAFYDDSTVEVVQDAVGEDAFKLYRHDPTLQDRGFYERFTDRPESGPDEPVVDLESFYDAFTAKYVLGDDDIGGNMLDDGDGHVRAVDFELGGRSISSIDHHVVDKAAEAADYLGINFRRDQFYLHVEKQIEPVDIEALETSIVKQLGPDVAAEQRPKIDAVLQNIEDIRDGRLWEFYADDVPGPGAT